MLIVISVVIVLSFFSVIIYELYLLSILSLLRDRNAVSKNQATNSISLPRKITCGKIQEPTGETDKWYCLTHLSKVSSSIYKPLSLSARLDCCAMVGDVWLARQRWSFTSQLRLCLIRIRITNTVILLVRWSHVHWGGHFERRFQRQEDVANQPLLVSQYQCDCPFVWYQNICSASFSFVTIHLCDRRTDGRTDGRTGRRTDRITTPKTALAYGRTVKIDPVSIQHLQLVSTQLYTVGQNVVWTPVRRRGQFCRQFVAYSFRHLYAKNYQNGMWSAPCHFFMRLLIEYWCWPERPTLRKVSDTRCPANCWRMIVAFMSTVFLSDRGCLSPLVGGGKSPYTSPSPCPLASYSLYPFPAFLFLSLSPWMWLGFGGRSSTPASPGRACPPNAFWCVLQKCRIFDRK